MTARRQSREANALTHWLEGLPGVCWLLPLSAAATGAAAAVDGSEPLMGPHLRAPPPERSHAVWSLRVCSRRLHCGELCSSEPTVSRVRKSEERD